MSEDNRGNSQSKKSKLGSVRAARERLEAGIQDRPQQPSTSQWPLSSQGGGGEAVAQSIVSPPTNLNRGPPPQRPPRPTYVPAILDSSRMREQMAGMPSEQIQDSRNTAAPQQAKYWESNYVLSPQAPGTPGTGISSSSSRDSTGSSVGSIPEFPVPALPANPAPPSQFRPRNVNLGPPPSARRGASSYYSQSSYVAPIPEEAWEPSSPARRAFPSKRREPPEWNDDASDYYGTRGPDDDEPDDRDSRSTDPDDTTGLVRKASLGKQYKPSLTTVRSFKETPATRSIEPTGAAAEAAAIEGIPVILDDVASPTFLRGPSEESEERKGSPLNEKFSDMRSNSPRNPPVDPHVELIMGGLEKGGALRSGTMAPELTSFDGIETPFQRPPPIDMNRVREGEARGSMSSLTDLIRRATRVASNLEKGRTASRLGMLDMFSSSNPNLLKTGNEQRRNSVSDMLSSFPAPGLGTPSRSPRPESRWPSPFVNADIDAPKSPGVDTQKRPPRRRCCGMPLWVFILLLIVLFLLIAAAVVIPVVLIVLPRLNQPSAPSNPLANCAASNPCSNSGTSVVSSNSCRCVCANGFTGSNCTTAAVANSGCTSTKVDNFQNATLGTSIPRLFTGASPNFSVPLNTTALLSDFSANSMACTDENNLVSFTGGQQRRDLPHPVREYIAPLPLVTLVPRMANPEPQSPLPTTIDTIIFDTDGPTSTAPNLATTAGPTPTATASSSSSGPNSTQMDFAGIAMLFIFQQTQLSTASNARTSLQNAFDAGSFSGPVVVTDNITVDVNLFRIQIGNTTVGKSE